MKKIIIYLLLVVCPISIVAQEKLEINTEKSTIKWIGEYTFYFGGHEGFINFEQGYFLKKDNVLIGGEFIIDMTSITNTDIKEQEGKDNLVDHLKDPDFFDVKKYPKAKLTITAVEYFKDNRGKIYADLTLKGITKPINFNVDFNYENKELTTKFKIDRKEWNVNYQSKFKDGAISDAIGFIVSIKL